MAKFKVTSARSGGFFGGRGRAGGSVHSGASVAFNQVQVDARKPPSGDTQAKGQFGRPSGRSGMSPLGHINGVARGIGRGKLDTSDGP